MLEQHPDTMTDEDLYKKINSWVHTKTPESIFLDYKKELIFETQKQKIELGKDISSFANTKGGCLLYGIDEDRQSIDSAPVPKKEYGIEPINRQLIDIENILSSIISPPLPELRIRQISLEHDINKIVYLIWHPKSWVAPHMVTGFKDNKYYKRGNFKSEPMEEHEVDILYQVRNLTNNKLRDFIKNIEFGLNHVKQSNYYLKFVVSPYYLSPYSKYFNYSDASNLIEPNHLIRDKVSFLNGVTFISHDREFVIKTYFNGIFSICYNLEDHITNMTVAGINLNILFLKGLIPILNKIMNMVASYYKKLHFYGPVTITFLLDNSNKMYLHYDELRWIEYMRHSEFINYVWSNTTFEFEEVFPITDILSRTSAITEILTNRIKHGFGCYKFEQS
ncbi:MAG: ATP-binding protein [Syntrophobacterales bacterium]|jgi:hypothetical protein|nr:ATP-binding protein [Syntrophobacterales bacterium]